MKETGDNVNNLCRDCKVNADIVKQLKKVSEEKQPPYLVGLCGWTPTDSDEILQMIYSYGRATKLPDDVQSEQKKYRFCHGKFDLRVRRKKTRYKSDPVRLGELSAPRRVREKVKVAPVSRVLLPFNETSTFSSRTSEQCKIPKIAFQYRKDGNKTLKYMNSASTFPRYHGESNKFAIQRQSIERSLHDFVLSKSRSANSADRFSKMFESTILTKTRENSYAADDDRLSSMSFPSVRSDPDLPLPRKPFVDRKPAFDAFLPPIRPNKSQLGSITAISDGNKKVGIKSNSIKKLRRHPIPRPPQILPKLAGSKVEVPLLPRSPDFLYRMF